MVGARALPFVAIFERLTLGRRWRSGAEVRVRRESNPNLLICSKIPAGQISRRCRLATRSGSDPTAADRIVCHVGWHALQFFDAAVPRIIRLRSGC